MAGKGILCDYCRKIPFNPRDLRDPQTPRTFLLGSGPWIERSRCPFCKLVVRLARIGRRQLDTCSEVEVTWDPLGPGGRRIFQAGFIDGGIGFGIPDRAQETPDDDCYVRKWNKTTIDAEQILRWVSKCDSSHGGSCRKRHRDDFSSIYPGLPVLRLIDVEADCLVEKREPCKYVALSYVWGSVRNFKLTKANRPRLLAPASLSLLRNRLLPITIRDAITLVRQLGARYLWVDSLCLLQNDPDDLRAGVNVMDSIYEQAWLTIIAGDGHDADAGLAGVGGSTRKVVVNTYQVQSGIYLGVVAGLDTYLKTTVYNSRAWTFQEQLLSRRALYFVNKTMYFRCRKEDFVETCIDNPMVPSGLMGHNIGSMLPGMIHMQDPIVNYGEIIFYYSKRVLTDQGDALRAMAGIIRRFSGAFHCRFLEGLPTAVFDAFLVFQGFLLARRPAFPSYSWTGWRGELGFSYDGFLNEDVNKVLRDRTWILWYQRRPSGNTDLVWDPAANPSFRADDASHEGYRERRAFSSNRRVPLEPDNSKLPLNTTRTAPTQHVQFERSVPAYPLLQFWTVSVWLAIGEIDVFLGCGFVFDRHWVKCGVVWLDGFEEHDFFDAAGGGGRFEMVFLSEAEAYGPAVNVGAKLPLPAYRGVDSQVKWSFYSVLLLEWQGGIAERRGFGQVFKGALENSFEPGPSWKEIFLA